VVADRADEGHHAAGVLAHHARLDGARVERRLVERAARGARGGLRRAAGDGGQEGHLVPVREGGGIVHGLVVHRGQEARAREEVVALREPRAQVPDRRPRIEGDVEILHAQRLADAAEEQDPDLHGAGGYPKPWGRAARRGARTVSRAARRGARTVSLAARRGARTVGRPRAGAV